ncbi:MAG: N-acetylneuraminate synthase family protein [Patescibacteria group bacterium]
MAKDFSITVGNKKIGHNHPVFIIAEIGINHNGDLDIVKKLIDVAVDAGADAVKFQKRTIEVVYMPEALAAPRESPFGKTNGDLKKGLEFGVKEYKTIDGYCRQKGILWFASCWDEGAVDFIEKFNPPVYKIASPSLTDHGLLRHIKAKKKPIILSTGMSDLAMVRKAVSVLGKKNLALMHSVSTYPASHTELNLLCIPTLRKTFGLPTGYSGHEVGIISPLAAVALGACLVERHITLDRAMWGSDQAASLEPYGFKKMIIYIRQFEASLGDGVKRIMESEVPVLKKLRRK